MAELMRCLYCGLLQDEPAGVKECQRCGGELVSEKSFNKTQKGSYLQVQMELDQVSAPPGQMIDRYLLLTLRTPEKVPEEYAAKTISGRPALSFHAVVDTSGSMHGEKMEQTKQALRMAVQILHEGDVISLSVFSDKRRLILKPTVVNAQSKNLVKSIISEIQPGGMTALYGGLELGIKQANNERLESNLVLLLSDGQTNVGETDLEIIGQLAGEAAGDGIVVSTLGVGMGYNEALMTEIATQGRGRFYHIQSSDQIVPILTGELGEAADIAARDANIKLVLPQGATAVPLSSVYKAGLTDGELLVSIGDIPLDLEMEIPLRLTLFPGKEGERMSVEGEVQYVSPADVKLSSQLNRVTVRFERHEEFKANMGVVEPVAERIAHQMRASQVLRYSRAVARKLPEELKQADREGAKLKEYLGILNPDVASSFINEIDADIDAVRQASPRAKNVTGMAYHEMRSMRSSKKKRKK
jgi:Ca-activated chloride channel homolog